ncbi:transmembrane emp24 domain-containing protein 10-like [Cimex lectularius]|uniref:GOLD domain-containing protein n=1 Tax=Cimex lectularius TaxID=79782 RepID=A0A8I6TFE8_CIMLE|nr:transmembrane emp24 domain-containing protein 10-like [Cimex lectularius]
MFFLLALICLDLYNSAESINFYLDPNVQKCLREEVSKDVLVIGEYNVTNLDEADSRMLPTKLLVTDEKRHILAKVDDARKGRFSFILEETGLIEICFHSESGYRPKEGGVVWLSIRKGVETKNYEELAEVAKLKPMEGRMARLEDFVEAIVDDFVEMKEREVAMSNTNESTKSRVFYLSIFNFSWLFALAAGQIIYLRQFFKSKKLIE